VSACVLVRNNQLFQFVFRLEPLSFREYAHGLGEVTGVMQGVGDNLVLSQPTTPPPPPLLVHRVLSPSSAKSRWWVPKQVSISDVSLVAGSYMASCLPDRSTGVSIAEGRGRSSWREPLHAHANPQLGAVCQVTVNERRPVLRRHPWWLEIVPH
jgi:hypothetical protein